ncbi:MAG: alpha/beta fold hydrolase [Defluviitaleaceae bacterium]|nr:alpha/beta fold hydrolase [Defluviitaleaceae bacterium]
MTHVRKMIGIIGMFVLTILFISACGAGNGENGGDTSPPATTPAPAITATPTPAPAAPTAPESYHFEPIPAVFHEAVVVGYDGLWPLNGILSVPSFAMAQAPVPGVIIVQGSGPSDMDGTLLDSHIYRDMAELLSANGVAVLRNEKRSYTHANALNAMAMWDLTAFGSFTVWEEAIEDALLGFELLLTDPRIDPTRIYLLGHSLGATLAPRIQLAALEQGLEFAGLILMAATPREFTEVMLEQQDASIYYSRIFVETLEGDEYIQGQAQIASAQAWRDALAHYAPQIWDTPAEEAKLLFWAGASFYYFQDLASPNFAEAAAQINTSMLVMQGERDFQVRADRCFPLIQEILSGRDNVTFLLYEDLNHAFMPSTATNFTEHAAERAFALPYNVAQQPMRDIIDWIHTR